MFPHELENALPATRNPSTFEAASEAPQAAVPKAYPVFETGVSAQTSPTIPSSWKVRLVPGKNGPVLSQL